MSTKKAIVVGAGIVGLSITRALHQKGYEVKVFERHPKSQGASVRNFGMVWPVGQAQERLMTGPFAPGKYGLK